MTIVKGGFKCDICGKMIFLMPGENLRPMKMVGIDRLLHVHSPTENNHCLFKVKRAMAAKDYKLLPYGPLKEMYYQALREQKAESESIGGNGRLS